MENTISENIIFTYSKLGQPFFLKKDAIDCRYGISPTDWNIEELKKISLIGWKKILIVLNLEIKIHLIMNPFKPSNLKGREQLLIDNWTKILSQEVIEDSIQLDQWALKVDPNNVRVRKINGYLNLFGLGLTEIPEWIGRIEEVNGSFYCNQNQLTTLKNSPQKVNGSFWCYENQLSSLEGLSKWIGGELCCYHNSKVFTLDDIPKDVKIEGKICFN